MSNELNDFLRVISEGKKNAIESTPGKKALKHLSESLHASNPFLQTVSKSDIEVAIQEVVESPVDVVAVEDIVEALEQINEVIVPNVKPATDQVPMDQINRYLSRNASFQQPDPEVVDPSIRAVQDKLKFLEQAVGKIAATGPGSGEVLLRYLDDVDRSTIAEGRHLAYNATTKKFFFENVNSAEPQVQSDWNVTDDENLAFIKNKPTIPSGIVDDNATTDVTSGIVSVINLPNDVIGPIQGMVFDTTHVHTAKDVGTLCWNDADRTLNIQHPNDVTQQVGQESYMLVRNNTGSTIPNATSVRFSGSVGVDGEARITVAPFLADGTYPSLYAVGISTEAIVNGADGFITVFGKVREIDTTGSSVSETWALGDILYAHPTIAGSLTRVKPTAPYNVVPMAAVVTVDDTDGEIFVRPTIEQKYSYGRFSRTTDATVVATNTAYTITFNSIETSNGVNVGSPASRLVVDQSGLYQIDINAQVEIAGNNNSTGTMYMWLRKNGTDIANSMRRQGQRGEVPSLSFSYNIVVSLVANDYVEVAYAADDANMRFDATDATSFGPSTAAVLIGVTQIQL